MGSHFHPRMAAPPERGVARRWVRGTPASVLVGISAGLAQRARVHRGAVAVDVTRRARAAWDRAGGRLAGSETTGTRSAFATADDSCSIPSRRRGVGGPGGADRAVGDGDARSDAALVLAIAAGDRQALAALYDRYAGLLLGVGVRVLRSRGEAEDIVHDVFLEVWRRAHTYEPQRASVRAWLLLMMRCRALDRRKSHAFALATQLERDPRVAPISESPPVALDRARVVAALEALPEPQRTVLLLGYFEGLSSSEIAVRIGAPVGTVKSRIAGALRALRERLSSGHAERAFGGEEHGR
jgi:RNA polymerase sigma-70 factor (ECF subfamily)